MKALFQKGVLVLLCLVFTGALIGQGSADYTGGLKVKLNDDGSKYFRLISWHQMWSTTTLSNSGNPNFESSTDFLLRRVYRICPVSSDLTLTRCFCAIMRCIILKYTQKATNY